ncbi:ARM repeat-containing protein [Meira miltonrushii]|uniref:ARM repeat-containing protein n=1 Tax=Meira miltonrushii TaxID=1280837 RepID=A0A316V666_9BASI|nr:ARM repeat-containing protein [Meira miltonrushii]PWN31703.1 ARM repeat-containing protein [Meira miltonrushii]
MIGAGTNAEGAAAEGSNPNAAPSTSKLTIEREKKRIAIRSANLQVWQDGPKALKGPLDSNMKKNTAFIKRIRQTLGAETKDQLIKDATSLNLDKYIEEIVQAIPEGLSKCNTSKDCIAAAESLGSLHARFATSLFAQPLSTMLASQLVMPSRVTLQAMSADQREKEEQTRVQKQRIMFKAAAELAITELIRQEKGKSKADPQDDPEYPGQEWLFTMLKDLLVNDREHSNVPILISLLKSLGSTLIGSQNGQDNVTEMMSKVNLAESDSVVKNETQAKFRKLFETYFSTLGKRIVKEHSRLQEQDKRNHEAYIRSGEIFEDRQQNYEKMAKTFERMHEWGKTLSDLLGVPLPPLSTDAKSVPSNSLAVNLDSRSTLVERDDGEFVSGKSKWEDEETRRFYEELVDLQEMVPPALLQQGQPKAKTGDGKAEADPQNANGKDGEKSAVASPQLNAKSIQDDKDAEKSKGFEENVAEGLAAGPAAQLNAFLASLTEMSNRTMIDSAAVDFAFLNNKIARKRLVKQVLAIPRNRSDLIPYYARLVATLNKYMPDVGAGVIEGLDEEFRFLQRKKNVDMAETRAKNTRFLGELVKFEVTPIITIFHAFKVCLDDFNGPNIENIATLLETCGRYLLRNEETSERMRSSLELLRRKKAAQNLDARQLVLLDNAYYQCNPPEREAVATKKRTPMESYINHLIYDVLARRKEDRVLKQLRKMNWKDEVTLETLHNVFTRSWRIKFSNLHLLAVVLYDLQTYHFDFVVHVIDTVCEQIRVGMETNIFKDNQRRVATIKYLGELYNYRLINTDIVFEQLWSLASFGHPQGRPLPGQISPIDAPDDYFRIRLVCTLLDVCGMCFDRGELRERLDDYLLMFNIYILSKEQPLPMDIDFMLSDTMDTLRPDFVLKRNFEEAAVAVDAMLQRQQAAAAAAAAEEAQPANVAGKADAVAGEVDEDEDDVSSVSSSSSEESEEDAPRHVSKDDASTDSESSSDEDGFEDEEQAEEDAEANAHVRRERSAIDEEAEDEFERELAKMMAESNTAQGSNSNNKRGLFDIGIPFIKRTAANQNADNPSTAASRPAGSPEIIAQDGIAPEQHMRFSLLSKRGNKQHTQDVHVPIDAALAVHSRAAEQKQLAERQQLKKLVLGMETREQAEDRSTLEASLAKKGFRVRQQQQQGRE